MELVEPNPAAVKVGIVGGGLMGHALAAFFLSRGSEVYLFEADVYLRASLPGRMRSILVEIGCGIEPLAQLTLCDSLEAINPGAHLLIEAIPENLGWKQELFAKLESLLPNAVLASNSSVYRVGDVAGRMSQRGRTLGTHWWNPPHLIPLVEVIQGDETASEVVNWTIDLLRRAGKTPVHVRKDTAGFIGNRLQHALWREALALVEEGIADAETVDLVARNTLGLKLGVMGPLENADYVGLDLTHAIHQYLLPTLSRSDHPSPLLINALSAGTLGAKSGEGLMKWPEGRRSEAAARLGRHLRQQLRSQKTVEGAGTDRPELG